MGKPVDKHLIAIVDGNPRHREQVSEALLSFYATNTYSDVTNALMGLGLQPPGLVLVGEQVPPTKGINFIKAMRRERALTDTPVVFVSDTGDPAGLQAALAAGATDCLMKPYRRSNLIRTVSAQLNAKVEGQWKLLPESVRDALESTLTVFNGIADSAESSYPLQYLAVVEACEPLVDAVQGRDLKLLFDALVGHDNFTYAHSLRVGALLALFGQAIGLPRSQQVLLASGGLLHDIGKLAIRHAVLTKREPLTEEESEIVRGHVPASVQLLKASDGLPRGVVTIAAQHHERLDGSGYPAGLSGVQLNEVARMVAIADIFADLTEPHAYRRVVGAEPALWKMAEEMGNQLDGKLLQRFRETVLDLLQPPRVSREVWVPVTAPEPRG